MTLDEQFAKLIADGQKALDRNKPLGQTSLRSREEYEQKHPAPASPLRRRREGSGD
ncbi:MULTISPECIES: hypothetical protein [unclassified Microbacterium]|uniref:hypothetical protein n=1 Tax=unclassified Microbacterium TaxID=2609290 RepID=UPI001443CB04|nr:MULTISPECIES: hypothetical protein [unclassified Microbacterium]